MAKKAPRIDRRISVILLEANKHLGERYEIVKVKAIFAKNVLFAKGLAVLADKDSLNGYKAKMASATRHKEKKTEGYTSLFKQIIDDNGIQFSMKTNEKGILYEKIDAVHIANRIKELYAVDIEDHFFKMKKKITQTGEYTIVFQYNTIEKDVHVVVKSENNKHITEKVEEVVEQIA